VRGHARICETDEVGDDQLGNRLRSDGLQLSDHRELVALIAQHLVNEVSSGAVVLDYQDLSYGTDAGGFAPVPQF
jgi:urease gamma subunit